MVRFPDTLPLGPQPAEAHSRCHAMVLEFFGGRPEAPPWDARPVSGAGVIHYHLLHRPRSLPTALGPAPLITIFKYHIYIYQTHQILYKYILCFFSLWWMIKGIWALFSLLFRFLWIRKPWLDNFMFIITLECSKLWIWMGIYFRDIWLIRISRGANNCIQCVFEKKTFIL